MGCITEWYDQSLADEFIRVSENAGGTKGVTLSDINLTQAPQIFDYYLEKTRKEEDAVLAIGMQKHKWVREVISRATISRAEDKKGIDCSVDLDLDNVVTENREKQLELFPDIGAGPEYSILRRLPPSKKWEGTVWVGRILWALEWARRVNWGPITAGKIAKILAKHNDVSMPASNISKALRDFKKKKPFSGLWQSSRKGHEITSEGVILIKILMHDEWGPGWDD
jgi:hypothetical protein